MEQPLKPDALKLMLAGEATLRKFRIVQAAGLRLALVAMRAEVKQIEGDAKKPGRKKKGGGA